MFGIDRLKERIINLDWRISGLEKDLTKQRQINEILLATLGYEVVSPYHPTYEIRKVENKSGVQNE